MKQYFTAYLLHLDALLAAGDPGSGGWDGVLAEHTQKIAFFQHERLVHLLVMLTVALATAAVGLLLSVRFTPLAAALLPALVCLLVPYVLHYYFLENGVQKLYVQYDALLEKRRQAADAATRP